MIDIVLILAILFSIFVAFNIGGSSTGIAWGPAVGAGILKKTTAALLMTFFVFLGGITVGQNVIDTLSGEILTSTIPLEAGVAILFFIGLGIMLANIFGVPVPTSMTTVGAIVGYGVVEGIVDFEVIGEIVTWWIITPVVCFWIGALIGRYIYPKLNEKYGIESTEEPIIEFNTSNRIPRIGINDKTSKKELITTSVILVVGSYMSFSAGASNIPNAVAPLVSSGVLDPDISVIIATVAICFGGLTIARRTMESVGTELTDIPLLVALIVMVVSATITTILSYMGIPISLVMSMVMTIIGIGWGRATRPVTITQTISPKQDKNPINFAAMKGDKPKQKATPIGEPEPDHIERINNLFRPRAVIKYLSMWIIGPSVSAFLSYAFFSILILI